jgi:hypothetical protein
MLRIAKVAAHHVDEGGIAFGRPDGGEMADQPDEAADESLLRIITMYGERRPRESSLRFGRRGPACIPDRTLI